MESSWNHGLHSINRPIPIMAAEVMAAGVTAAGADGRWTSFHHPPHPHIKWRQGHGCRGHGRKSRREMDFIPSPAASSSWLQRSWQQGSRRQGQTGDGLHSITRPAPIMAAEVTASTSWQQGSWQQGSRQQEQME